jgi:hypothetical protein
MKRTRLAAWLRTLPYWPGADVLSRGATLKSVRLVSLAGCQPSAAAAVPQRGLTIFSLRLLGSRLSGLGLERKLCWHSARKRSRLANTDESARKKFSHFFGCY